jgi:hypothetical protein
LAMAARSLRPFSIAERPGPTITSAPGPDQR